MKVLTISGSPRLKGNSVTLTQYFDDVAQKNGAETKTYHLNELNYKGCQGCMSCKKELEYCILEDDLTPILDGCYDADIIVLASPNYYGHVTGQMKCFIDRTFSLLTPRFLSGPDRCRLPHGKSLVLIFTQSSDGSLFRNVITYFKEFARIYDIEDVHIIRGYCLSGPDDAEYDDELIKKIERTAEKLTKKQNLRLSENASSITD